MLEEGQEVEVKLIGFDRGKMKLSMKALSENVFKFRLEININNLYSIKIQKVKYYD